MGKLTSSNETSDPIAPDTGKVVLYPKSDQWYFRKSDGTVSTLKGGAILFGTGVPSSGLGSVGDFYEDTLTGFVYSKTGVATWTFQDDITGPSGPAGPTGPAGPPGGTAFASDVAATAITDSTPSAGVGSDFSRFDHVHSHGVRGGGTLHAVATTSVAGFLSATDKTKLDGVATGATNTPLTSTAPNDVTKSAAVVGVSTEAARRDHKHDISTASVSTIGTANAEGSATSLARSDHTHNHGAQTSGTLHAEATTSVAGFLSAADKTTLGNLYTDPFSVVDLQDHFIEGSELTDRIGNFGWRLSTAGTAANGTRIDGEARRAGIFRITAGTAATGRAALHLGESGGLAAMLPGTTGVVMSWKSRVRLTGTLSTFEMFIAGIGDVQTAVGDQTNGIYFQLLGSPTPDTNWFLVAANGGTRTRLDTGIAFTSTNWIDLEWTLSAATLTGKINGTTFSGSITTNLPTAAVSPTYKADGITAGTAVNCDIDIFRLTMTGMTF